MDIQINGDTMHIPTAISTIEQLAAHLQLQSPVIIAEHNGVILEKEEHATTPLADGDKVEFVQFVGGG